MEEQKIKEQIRDKKAELFDIQVQIGTLEALKQQKINELNQLLIQEKNDKKSDK